MARYADRHGFFLFFLFLFLLESSMLVEVLGDAVGDGDGGPGAAAVISFCKGFLPPWKLLACIQGRA